MSDFGNLLRELRRQAGLSQRQLADRAKVDFSYISKLENDRLPPPAAETIVRFATLIGCPAEDLLAAARKIPGNVGKKLSSQPAALKFLQEASAMDLSQEEWDSMLGTLHELRSDSGDRKRRI